MQYRSVSESGYKGPEGIALRDLVGKRLVIDGAEMFDSEQYGPGVRFQSRIWPDASDEPDDDEKTVYTFSQQPVGFAQHVIPEDATRVTLVPPFVVRVQSNGRSVQLVDA